MLVRAARDRVRRQYVRAAAEGRQRRDHVQRGGLPGRWAPAARSPTVAGREGPATAATAPKFFAGFDHDHGRACAGRRAAADARGRCQRLRSRADEFRSRGAQPCLTVGSSGRRRGVRQVAPPVAMPGRRAGSPPERRAPAPASALVVKVGEPRGGQAAGAQEGPPARGRRGGAACDPRA
jgi:hypothetical protein